MCRIVNFEASKRGYVGMLLEYGFGVNCIIFICTVLE